jgi:hypothetical protein
MAITTIVVEDNAGTHTERALGTTPTELGYVDGVTSAIQTQLDDKEPIGKFSRMVIAESECWPYATYGFAPFANVAIASGTLDADAPSVHHPGIVLIVSSTSANSGQYIGSASSALLLGGGGQCECVFNLYTTALTICYLGFHDSATYAAPVDGVWIDIQGTTLKGVTSSNSSATNTGTTYTITQGVWYRYKIVLNADATLATFTLYTCADGIAVWTDTCATNIPTGAGRYTGMRMLAVNTGTTAVTTLALDWYRYSCSRVLVR